MSGGGRPEVLSTGAEREVLISRLEDGIEHAWRTQLQPGGEPFDLASVAVTAVLRSLRVLSARQLAVLLADEANRHEEVTIHEPPRYTAEETEGAG